MNFKYAGFFRDYPVDSIGTDTRLLPRVGERIRWMGRSKTVSIASEMKGALT